MAKNDMAKLEALAGQLEEKLRLPKGNAPMDARAIGALCCQPQMRPDGGSKVERSDQCSRS